MSMAPFSIGHYKFNYFAKEQLRLPEYSGQTWRGGFGYALKRIACVTHMTQCEPCLLYQTCVYTYLFETPPPSDSKMMRLYKTIPHPFVIRPGQGGTFLKNAAINVEFILFGQSYKHLPYLVHAMKRLGESGIGKEKTSIKLASVEQSINGQWQEIYTNENWNPITPEASNPDDMPETVTITLKTPLRIKNNNHVIKPHEFVFSHLFKNVLRRISMISAFHENNSLELDYKGLNELSERVDIVDKELSWKKLSRYSTRQKKRINLDGIIGKFTINKDNLTALWPYLWLGQFTHAGKATSMGLGEYMITNGNADKLVLDDSPPLSLIKRS